MLSVSGNRIMKAIDLNETQAMAEFVCRKSGNGREVRHELYYEKQMLSLYI